MITSALTTVLAPPWSGRLRRFKQDGNEVESQDDRQNSNPSIEPSPAAVHAVPRETAGLMFPYDGTRFTTESRYNSPDWQKENSSPNITSRAQLKRVKLFSTDSQGNVYDSPGSPDLPSPVGQMSKSGYGMANTEPFKSISSKPTTSSLLLSLRRSNLRERRAGTQNQSPSSLVRSFTLPRKSVLKHSPLFNPSTTTTDQITEVVRLDPAARSSQQKVVALKTQAFVFNSKASAVRSESPVASPPHQSHTSSKLYSPEEPEGQNHAINNIQQHNLSMGNLNRTTDGMMNIRNMSSPWTQNMSCSNSNARTFTDQLVFTPKKSHSSVDGPKATNVERRNEDWKSSSQLSQSPMDISSPLSPCRPLRHVRVPSLYSYLRESSPTLFSSSSSSPSPSSNLPREEPEHRTTSPLRFSFDVKPSLMGSGVPMSPAQSLPPDFGRRSAPRLSRSPYSTLISNRSALNSASPADRTQNWSDGEPLKSSLYTSSTQKEIEKLVRYNREPSTAALQDPSPSQTDSGPGLTHCGSDRKAEESSQDTSERKTGGVQTHNLNTDAAFSSSQGERGHGSLFLPDRESVSPQHLKSRRHTPVFKTTSKIDQVLNRLKLTFSAKRPEGGFHPVSKNSKTPVPLAPAEDRVVREEKRKKSPQLVLSSDEMAAEVINSDETANGTVRHSTNPILTLPLVHVFKSLESGKSTNALNVDQRSVDENGNHCESRRLKTTSTSRSATLPHFRKSSAGPPSPFYLFDFDSDDFQNDNVFCSPVSSKRQSSLQENPPWTRWSSSCADLKYGLENWRSFSVSGVFSSRPSGPGRISTSSVDDVLSKGNVTDLDSPSLSTGYKVKIVSDYQPQILQNPDKSEYCFYEDADPTPPPSPTFSPSSRRISQAPSPGTPDSLSPHGVSPSRSYRSSLSVFEESSSDTTTDDEYYFDGDELETEL